MNIYNYGETVKISGVFTAAGVLTNPTTVTLKIHTPAGVETSYTYAAGEVTREATGKYYREVLVNEAGEWFYRWEGTGAVQGADEDSLFVQDTEFS